MSFQFVNVTPDRPEPDAATRKRIRSQAMRDFRRRQKLEEQSSSSSDETSPQPSISPRPSSSGLQGGRPSPWSSAVSGRGPVSGERLLAGEDTTVIQGASSRSSSGSAKSPRRSRRLSNLRPPSQRGSFSTFSIALPPPAKLQAQQAQDSDPLSQPGQLDQMVGLCESYNRWLLSGLEDRGSPIHASGSWDHPSSQMLLFALCLKAVGHMEALNPGQTNFNRRLFKTRVLALANRRLKNPAKALEDTTLSALACLTSYEISRGSTEAMMHLHGMSQIISLRGGTEKIGQGGGLCMFLEILDLMHAVYFNSTALYTPRPEEHDTAMTTPAQPDWLDEPMIDDAALEEISNFLLDLQDLSEFKIDEPLSTPPQPEPAITPSSFDQEVQLWYQYLAQAAETMASGEQGSLEYVCRLAAGLHLATTSAITPPTMRLQAQRDELFNAMLALPDSAWDTFETLHIRILLTGMSASANVAQKSWYNAHLTRQLYRTERLNWGELKGLILRFIDMQAAAKQPRTQAVRVLANDIEIVVDPAEAMELDMNLVLED